MAQDRQMVNILYHIWNEVELCVCPTCQLYDVRTYLVAELMVAVLFGEQKRHKKSGGLFYTKNEETYT